MPESKPTRGRPPSFDRQTLLDAATTVIDRDGLEQCTVRTVASEIGVTAMALYRHASSKDELLSFIPDHLVGRHRKPFPEGDGIDGLFHIATTVITVLEAHPAASPLFMQPTMGPEMGSMASESIARLVNDSYTPARAGSVLRATVALVIGLSATGGEPDDHALGPLADDALQIWLTGLRHTPAS